jgi:hypothetical protein
MPIPFVERSILAGDVRRASESLLEASERATELKRFKLSTQLLDQSVELHQLAREILELPRQTALDEERLDPPF